MYTMSATNSNNSPSKSASTPAEENATGTENEQVINLHDLISASVKEHLGGFLADFKKEAMAQIPHSSKRPRLPPPDEESDDEPPKKIAATCSHTDALMDETESEAGEINSSSEVEEEEKEWLQRMTKGANSEEKGPPLSEKIAKTLSTRCWKTNSRKKN